MTLFQQIKEYMTFMIGINKQKCIVYAKVYQIKLFFYEARQFGGTNLVGDNLSGKIYWQANLSVSQFGRKINKNDLLSLVLRRQQKNFVMSQRQLKRQL